MRIGGVRVPVMPPGDKLNMSAVNRAIQDPTYFRNAFLRGFASSIGISFEQLAKNFSDANYSAARAALLDVWQGIMRLRFWFGQHVLRSEEHTSELQSLMRISYAVFCLKKKKQQTI